MSDDISKKHPRADSEADGTELPPSKIQKRESIMRKNIFGSLMEHKVQAVKGCRLEPLHPLGLIIHREVQPDESTELPYPNLPGHLMKLLCYQYGFIVLRNWKTLDEFELTDFAKELGEPVIWQHGPVLHLRPSDEPVNFVMSFEALPMHWDLMFPPAYLEAERYEHFTASFQMFQCVEAPRPGDGGQTTFCDGRLLLQAQSPETVEEWRGTQLRYFTRMSYFGGKERSYPLVMTHPQTGDAIFRYHPRWDSKIQTVTVKSDDKSEEELEAFLQKMDGLLTDSRWYMEYEWQSGDLLVADNHYLLHARTPISRPAASRHLMRVQVLAR